MKWQHPICYLSLKTSQHMTDTYFMLVRNYGCRPKNICFLSICRRYLLKQPLHGLQRKYVLSYRDLEVERSDISFGLGVPGKFTDTVN